MMLDFTLLEAVVKRAPLGLRFRDMTFGTHVTDGLNVAAHEFGKSEPILKAVRSPVSGIYGFYSLPGFRPYEDDEKPASDWAVPSAPPNWIISVEDILGRFLPQVLPMLLPKEQLVTVPLYSSPERTPTGGYAVIRGELWNTTDQKPASWALVMTSNGAGGEYVGVADGRGVFVLLMPYPKPTANVPLNQQEWSLVFNVFYQPGTLRWSGQPDPEPDPGETVEEARRRIPPDTDALVQQAAATILDTTTSGAANALLRPLRYRFDLVLKTEAPQEPDPQQRPSQLWVVPA